MVKEAEANKEADKKRKEDVDTRNDAEQLVFATEKAIKDLGDKVDKNEKEEAEKLADELKEALKGEDIEDIKKKMEALNEKAMALATKVYQEAAKKAQAEQPSDASETTSEDSGSNKDDAINAEYEEK
jgi:molecular chaperone DnaK